MKFLEEIAKIVIDRYQENTDTLTIVFPNRRAGLFFRKYLSSTISRPVWSPKIQSIEDFIKGLSNLKSADKLELIYLLYKVFTDLNKSKEEFDKFYFWGNVLLQDFDEVDKFLVDASLLFKNLVHIKNLEHDLDFLDEEQKALIIGFWKSFGEKLSRQQEGFLGIWDNLYETYHQFQEVLKARNMAYDGMIYKEVVHDLKSGAITIGTEKVIFAGFNALSASEEEIISWFVKEGMGEVYWDADDYYLNDVKQEAGKYLREMKFANPVLRKSFKKSYDNAFKNSSKKVEVISVASEVGQAQEASHILKTLNTQIDEDTAVVLPNNALLFPVLHALPENVDKLNITMGYPLASSSIFGLLDALINLHLKSQGKSVFHFRNVLNVLKHPMIARFQDETTREILQDIQAKNILWIQKEKLATDHELHSLLFKNPQSSMVDYLIEVVKYLANDDDEQVEKEFAFQFYQLLNRLGDFMIKHHLKLSIGAFQKIFRQLAQNERLPFEGEPLLGLQLMGILETRNLDFKNIIVLSMNEGLIPPAPKNTSFIPYSIRKVFGLPVIDHQDAMYAYIFYRLVQRAENIYFIYNAAEEAGKSGEVSRFVRQLEAETDFEVNHRNITSEVIIEDPNLICVDKDKDILDQLLKFTSSRGYQKRLTPTAINTYLDCRLRFYYKYVLGLKEEDEMAEEVDAMVFGNILHHVMEKLYLPYDNDGKRQITASELGEIRLRVDDELNREFAIQFGTKEQEFVFEGQNVLAREIIKKMILKVLEFDQQQVPFEILGVEANEEKGYLYEVDITIGGSDVQVGMKGVIDRVELRDGHVRIVDYKTGKDQKVFPDIPSLFDRDNKNRNKAVLQTFIYGLLYLNAARHKPNAPVQASLFNIRDLFRSDFSPLIQIGKGNSKQDVVDIRSYLREFENELKVLINEIYDPEVPFSQTSDVNKCSYCPYSGLCNR